MKYTLILILIIFNLTSCETKEDSLFFEDCKCEKINFSDGINFTDSLNHYTVNYPDLSWYPVRNLDLNHNGVTGIDTAKGFLRIAAITETKKGKNWIKPEDELKQLRKNNQVIQEGTINFKKEKRNWQLVKYDNTTFPIYSLYIGIDKPEVYYTINLSVEKGENFKENLCGLESFLKYFEID